MLKLAVWLQRLHVMCKALLVASGFEGLGARRIEVAEENG